MLEETTHCCIVIDRSRVYSSDSGRKRGNMTLTVANRTWIPPTRPTTRLDQSLRTKLERSRHPRRPRRPWHNAWMGRGKDRHPTEKRQPGIDSFGPQPNLPLQDQTHRYPAPLHPWQSGLKGNWTLVYPDQPDDCRRSYKGPDSRQVSSIHRANVHDLEHQSSAQPQKQEPQLPILSSNEPSQIQYKANLLKNAIITSLTNAHSFRRRSLFFLWLHDIACGGVLVFNPCRRPDWPIILDARSNLAFYCRYTHVHR